jgi:hypothetical protein
MGVESVRHDAATGFTGMGEGSPLARGTQTVAQINDQGLNLSPREVTALGGDSAVVPWNQGSVANILNPQAPFVEQARAQSLPLQAGISGTSFRFMRLGEVMGMDPALVRLAAAAHLLPIGAHSYHEIASAAQGFQGDTSQYNPAQPYTPAGTGLTAEQLAAIAARRGLDLANLNAPQPVPQPQAPPADPNRP